MADATAQLNADGKEYSLPILEGTDGQRAIDVSELKESSGLYTYDPTLNNTAVTKSEITRIDAESGKLLYRGYDLAALVKDSGFVEVSYLLFNGNLPTKNEYEAYSHSLSNHSMVHESMRNVFDAFPGDAHPLAILATMVTALSSYYPQSYEENMEAGIDLKARLLAKVRTLAAWSYKKSIGHPVIYPRDELPYCDNLLNMMFAVPAEPYTVPADDARVLNQIFILYSDHEQNSATSTVRFLSSTRANLFVCINAGISALWGARESAYSVHTVPMLETMLSHNMGADKFFERFINGEEHFRSPAFGHAKYKSEDPRARLSRELLHTYLRKKDDATNNPFIEKGLEVEQYVLGHPFFKEMKIYPNLDFYSALIFLAMGIPRSMFNVMRVIGKMAGWLAQWEEERLITAKAMRPQQLYSGVNEREYVSMDQR